MLDECKYKKCIVWCRIKDIANDWFEIFKLQCFKYNNLEDMRVFLDHSGTLQGNGFDYDKFYSRNDKAILFCDSKFKQGTDIPYLSCCLYLDKVTNTCEIPFIQCIGRVLRKDSEHLKQYGHIIDGK